MGIRTRVGITGLTLVLLVTCGWIISCSDQPASPLTSQDTVTPPDEPGDPTLTLGGLLDRATDLLIDPLLEDTYILESSDTAHIDATAGGYIALTGLGDLNKVLVSDSSMTLSATITVEVFRPDGDLTNRELALAFGPDGLIFEKPITVELEDRIFIDPARSVRPVEVSWQYLNPATQQWEEQSRVHVSSDRIFRIPVAHFSTYRAIATRYEAYSMGGQR